MNFPNSYRKLWDEWNIRTFILISLFLQIILIYFATFRKRKKWVTPLVWSAYLLADWVAAFVLGLLVDRQAGSNCGPTGSDSNKSDHLLAFWAPFLLLHLGGPDTITAFSLEDNELWLRHMLGLLFEFTAAFYVFALTLPGNALYLPTILMFIAGLVKYAERTCALYFASMEGFRNAMLPKPEAGPNYAKLMEEYAARIDGGLEAWIEMTPEPDEEDATKDVDGNEHDEVDCDAFRLFGTFKRLIVDLIFSFHDRDESRKFFIKQDPEYAFKVIEIELSFAYEVLYTKAAVVHSPWSYYFFRPLCTTSILAAFVLFIFYRKRGFAHVDVAITYALLIGALCLDAVAFIMLISSDWVAVSFKKSRLRRWINASVIGRYLKNSEHPAMSKITALATILFKKPRWSEAISQFNLIEYCLHHHETFCETICSRFPFKDFLDEFRLTSHVRLEKDLKEFIFKQLKKKSEDLKDTKRLCASRGDWALEQRGYLSMFRRYVEAEFDESLLTWHIATDLLYYSKKPESQTCKWKKARERSKIISDYMLYLLVMQPSMMTTMAGIGQIRYQDTCAEASNFFIRRGVKVPRTNELKLNFVLSLIGCTKQKEVGIDSQQDQSSSGLKRSKSEEASEEASKFLLSVNTEAEGKDVRPIDVKGDRSKSVLFDACILAKKLGEVEPQRMWEIISEVWVEMLSYAASHCRGNSHAQQLSKGGELVTFVWFLMTHLGLGEQYRIESGHARAKLIVER